MPEDICKGPDVSEISPLQVLLGMFLRYHTRKNKENQCGQPGNLTLRAVLGTVDYVLSMSKVFLSSLILLFRKVVAIFN